jgi:hypothetical protein
MKDNWNYRVVKLKDNWNYSVVKLKDNWNYRVVKRIWNHPYWNEPTELFDICEVYYDENGDVDYMTDPVVTEDSIEDIRETLQWMLDSLDKPVIDRQNND